MADLMTYPDTVEEFMEQYKITDTDHVYTNGADMVPIFRMKQWFEHLAMVGTQMSSAELISRKAAIDALDKLEMIDTYEEDGDIFLKVRAKDVADMLGSLLSAQPEQRWIPIKTRPMADEERDYWSDQYGYDVEDEYAVMFDCEMPKDKQAIWVQSKCGYVFEDVCENDDGMIGLEGNGDWDDIVAWMPKYIPEPWIGEEYDRA